MRNGFGIGGQKGGDGGGNSGGEIDHNAEEAGFPPGNKPGVWRTDYLVGAVICQHRRDGRAVLPAAEVGAELRDIGQPGGNIVLPADEERPEINAVRNRLKLGERLARQRKATASGEGACVNQLGRPRQIAGGVGPEGELKEVVGAVTVSIVKRALIGP